MIGPVQNTPIPLEPARQQLSPGQPVATPQPQLPVAEQPLPPTADPKDKFAGKDGKQDNDDTEARRHQQQQQFETARALNNAWARLTALQALAREALGVGNGPQAKEAAMEAAAVAASIRDVANTLPGVSIGVVDIPAAIDSARSGVGAAMSVVDLAGEIPHHPIEDRQAITGARHQVIEAMAGVEAVAAELLPIPPSLPDIKAGKVNVKA